MPNAEVPQLQEYVLLKNNVSESLPSPTLSGAIKSSGSKLYIADGTTWNLVTSA